MAIERTTNSNGHPCMDGMYFKMKAHTGEIVYEAHQPKKWPNVFTAGDTRRRGNVRAQRRSIAILCWGRTRNGADANEFALCPIGRN